MTERKYVDLRGKRILLFSPEPWKGLHMSKHHLAQALAARGNEVVFLERPTKGMGDGIRARREGEITVVTYGHWLRGANRAPRPLHMWYYARLIRRIAAATGGAFDILWCFDTSRMQWFPKGSGYRLLHIADYNIVHRGLGLFRTADLVLSTGRVVKDHIEKLTGIEVHSIGHALDQRWLAGDEDLHTSSMGPPKRVMYAGQLAMRYHDWEGWLEVVRAHPDLEFTFVGPFNTALPEPAFHLLREEANATFPGLMSKEQLVPLLRQADILLFGYRSATLAKECANPHKLLEYLSTGNVIVGSWTMEYAERTDLIFMADQGAPLLPTFNEALARFEELNAPAARQRRIAFARERALPHMLDRIESLMSTTEP